METGGDDALADAGYHASVNPFMANYQTSDGGTINLCIVSPTGYIRDTFAHLAWPNSPMIRDSPTCCR